MMAFRRVATIVFICMIFVNFKLAQGANEFSIRTDLTNQRQNNVAISGDVIVWLDGRNGNSDIYGMNLLTGEEFPVCINNADQFDPAISGDIVVWADNRSGSAIYGKNLRTGIEFPICTYNSYKSLPAIWSNLVVWEDYRNGEIDIYGKILTGGAEFKIYSGGCRPSIYGDTIVWRENHEGRGGDIYGKSLATGEVFPVCTEISGQDNPGIYGDLVVYNDDRNGNWDIYGKSLSTGIEFPICTNTSGQYFPAISGTKIVWDDDCNGRWDIYGKELTSEIDFHMISIISEGRSEISFASDVAIVKYLSWGLPTNLVIDSIAIPMIWQNDVTTPIAFNLFGEYWIKKTSGRDGAYAVQTANGFYLGIIDNPNGPDTYKFEVRRSPSEISTDWMHVNADGGRPFGEFDFTGTTGFAGNLYNGCEITFSGTIDGTNEFIFRNGTLVIKNLSWGPSISNFSINDQPVSLTWNNGSTQEITLPMPERFQFIQTSGRCVMYPVETADGFVLSLADELLGGDSYRWKISTISNLYLGDANQDGVVDVGDLGILAANYGTQFNATWEKGDFNSDGIVDVGDLGILASHYGQGTTGGLNYAADAKALGLLVTSTDNTNNSNDIDATAQDELSAKEFSSIGPDCPATGLTLVASLLLAGLLMGHSFRFKD